MTIVLLAAGRATRMRGRDKLLEEIEGQPLLRVMAGRCVAVARTILVLGPGQDARRSAVDGLDLEICDAPEGAGMAASIVAGADGLTNEAILVALADMPELTERDLRDVIEAFVADAAHIYRGAAADGTPGHPVLFPADLVPELLQLEGDEGARSVLRRHVGRVRLVALPENHALTDLDTPEAWAAWRAKQKGRRE